MESEKLKPCPFCESEDVYIETFNGKTKARVRCAGCGTVSGFFNDVESATSTWNTRPTDAVKVALAEALAELRGVYSEDYYDDEAVDAADKALAAYKQEATDGE